jgi:hypothetical protein
MIAEVFQRIGGGNRMCVEFGAADGLDCSNTARLWKDDWSAVLIEAEGGRYQNLVENTRGHNVLPLWVKVDPTGPCSVDCILDDHEVDAVDFMSIDVDGADYLIWEQMKTRPRLISIEYNRSVPPTASLYQADVDGTFGQSALALVDLGTERGYQLVGLSDCNLFFVVTEEAAHFSDLERDLEVLFDYTQLAYLVTDYLGHVACLGTPPWGVAGPYLGDLVGPVHLLPQSIPALAGSVAPGLRGDIWASGVHRPNVAQHR